jgi:hypothetical protein
VTGDGIALIFGSVIVAVARISGEEVSVFAAFSIVGLATSSGIVVAVAGAVGESTCSVGFGRHPVVINKTKRMINLTCDCIAALYHDIYYRRN